jgi:flagellar M-ring protein FliF
LPYYTAAVANGTGISVENVTIALMEVPVFYDYIKPPVAIQQIIMFAVLALLILMLAYGLIRRTKPEEAEEEIEPELSVEDLLVSTQLEEAKEEAEKLEEIDYFKDSAVKQLIENFVDEKPEAVAQLLRNWLNTNEDW